jgi:hypothetical protein
LSAENYIDSDIDSDIDGIIDSKDLCPNTSFEDIVDESGCPINSEVHRYIGNLNIELEYKNISNSTINSTKSIYFDYTYRNYLLSYSSGIYDINSSSISSDKYLSIGYKYGLSHSILKTYLGLKLASSNSLISTTSDDSFVSLGYEYFQDDFIYFGALSYLWSEKYISYSIGSIYHYDDYEFQVSYYSSGSQTTSINEYQNLSFSMGYQINDKFYTKLSYNQSLDDSSIYDMGLSVGVSFE